VPTAASFAVHVITGGWSNAASVRHQSRPDSGPGSPASRTRRAAQVFSSDRASLFRNLVDLSEAGLTGPRCFATWWTSPRPA
jgi:hypothetical protein